MATGSARRPAAFAQIAARRLTPAGNIRRLELVRARALAARTRRGGKSNPSEGGAVI
ncbi:MAG TPA: hypothetical protein VD835_20235 [Pyrinomonadaceae bacterium]|nr:hypothetical protein [Pyrinomonadaceae bacterium]